MLDLNNPQNAHVEQRLRSNSMAWFGTVRADGRPHLVPVWFLWDGSNILIFSKPNNQKIRNLQHNQNVIVALDDTKIGSDVVVIEGKAELVDNALVNATLPAFAEKYAPLLNQMGWKAESVAAEYSQPIRVTPTKFVGWSG